MIKVMKQTNGGQTEYSVRVPECYMVMCLAQMNGWNCHSRRPKVFDQECLKGTLYGFGKCLFQDKGSDLLT